MQVEISKHFQSRQPSAIRQAQILFAQRPDRDQIEVINLAIGNVSLPMHPAMRERFENIAKASQFTGGLLKYTAAVGTEECQQAFFNILAAGGFATDKLRCLVTDGGSMAMELMILGVCGPASERPLLLLDPAYSNYQDLARRTACKTISLRRTLQATGRFTSPSLENLEATIREHKPKGLVVIPADNPTGQFLSQEELIDLARLCVKHNLWLISDEAYRQLHYEGDVVTSVWGLTEEAVPGITARRISIESSSKVWNACGLRIGALITDNAEFHKRAVAEYTANLCANAIGQHIFAALATQSHEQLRSWFVSQRHYYRQMMTEVTAELRRLLPGLIVSNPEAALYSVLDLREVLPDFDCEKFIRYCASEGSFEIEGRRHTLLLAPMKGFYSDAQDRNHPSQKQMRLAFVAPPAAMKRMPRLFVGLLQQYCQKTASQQRLKSLD